jgi:hypothetical protein
MLTLLDDAAAIENSSIVEEGQHLCVVDVFRWSVVGGQWSSMRLPGR